MTKKQKTMLEALEACFLNITEAAKMAKCSRTNHYKWLDEVDDYKKAYQELEDDRIKVAESQLHKNIMAGKETSLIFFLKCKAGYKETVQTLEKDVNITVYERVDKYT